MSDNMLKLRFLVPLELKLRMAELYTLLNPTEFWQISLHGAPRAPTLTRQAVRAAKAALPSTATHRYSNYIFKSLRRAWQAVHTTLFARFRKCQIPQSFSEIFLWKCNYLSVLEELLSQGLRRKKKKTPPPLTFMVTLSA